MHQRDLSSFISLRRNGPRGARLAWVVFFAAVAVGSLVSLYLIKQSIMAQKDAARAFVSERAANLEVEFGHSLSVLDVMATIVRQGNGNTGEFQELAPHFFYNYPSLLDIEMQENGIITDVFPLAGNEDAIGVNLFESDANVPLLQQIKASGELIVQGPLRLFQTEEPGMVARLPVYINDHQQGPRFWGFVTAIIRLDKLIELAGFNDLRDSGYYYELQRETIVDGEEKVIIGSGNSPLIDPVSRNISIPGGDWVLLMKPVDGWFKPGVAIWCGVITFLASFLIAVLVRSHYQVRMVAHELRIREAGIRQLQEMTISPSNIEESIQNCLELGCQIFDCEMGVLTEFDNSNCIVRFSFASEGFKPPEGAIFQIEKSCFFHALSSHSPVCRSGLGKEAGFQLAGKSEQFIVETYCGIPIKIQDRTFGSLSFMDHKKRRIPFSQIDHTMLSLIGTWLGRAMDHLMDRQRLLEARDEAEKANNAKDVFLSRMSHELRTPLNGIIGFSDLLCSDTPAESVKDYANCIRTAGGHLLQLIDDILDLSAIKEGQLVLSNEVIDLRSLIHEVMDLMRTLAREKNILFEFSQQPENQPVVIQGDSKRLKQVLLNLVSNGIKYNKNEGRLKIICDQTKYEDQVCLTVQDTGIGINEGKMGRIFTPFDRLDIERRQPGVKGTGLGLNVSLKLIEAMGGSIEVESKENEGTSFHVLFHKSKESVHKKNTQVQDETIVAKSSQEQQVCGGKCFTLLYIEDHSDNLRLITEILRIHQSDVQLLVATTGNDGFRIARQNKPDVILLDVNLPDINGDKVLELLNSDGMTRQIPVYILSADAMPDQINRLKSLGAAGYLTKPLDVRLFLKLINEQKSISDKSPEEPDRV